MENFLNIAKELYGLNFNEDLFKRVYYKLKSKLKEEVSLKKMYFCNVNKRLLDYIIEEATKEILNIR